MSSITNKPDIAPAVIALDFSFKDPVVSKGIAKVGTEKELFAENNPLSKQHQKELKDYEHKFSESFIRQANDNAVKVLLADDSVTEVRSSTKFGVHTYGKIEARSQREVTTRIPKTGETTVAPRASIKLTYGNIGKSAVKEMSVEFQKLLAKG